MRTILTAMSCASVVAWLSASRVGEQCKTEEATAIRCRCTGSEEFTMPEGYNYENVTSVEIAACASADLHFASFAEANRIAEIVVRNISDRLIFEPFLASRRMTRLQLSRIRFIPRIDRDTFARLESIETVLIEDARIGTFEETFADVAVNDFSVIGATVERIGELNFSARGRTLRIRDADFRSVSGSLNFAYYSSIEILRSSFRLDRPGHVLLEADLALLENCVFSNASVNVVAAKSIRISGTCADGKSSMRLSSPDVESTDNRLPTEIVYTRTATRTSDRQPVNPNNTVCRAGNCRCPKTSGQPVRRALRVSVALALLLVRIF